MKITLTTIAAPTLFQIACLLHLLLQCHATAKSKRKLSINCYGVYPYPKGVAGLGCAINIKKRCKKCGYSLHDHLSGRRSFWRVRLDLIYHSVK